MTSPRVSDRPLQVTVLDSPEPIVDEWTRLVTGGPPQLSPRWLRTYHHDGFDRPSRYAAVQADDGRLLAVCVFHIGRHDDHHRKYRIADLATHADVPAETAHRLASVAERPAVVVVSPSSYTSGWYVPGHGHPDPALIRALIHRLRRVAADCGAGSLLFPHNRGDRAGALAAQLPSSVVLPGDRVAHLDLGGVGDFSGYLARLPSARRHQVRRDRRKFADGGLSLRVRTDLDDLAGMVRRQCAHYERHGITPDPDRVRRQVQALHSNYGHDLTIVEVLRGGVAVGHVVVVAEGDWLVPRLAGFDAGVPFAYFEACYYRVVEMALGPLNRTLIDYGGASLSAKRWRGCDVTATEDVVAVLE